jgi:NADH dehydrogenase FAD-containing subunit
MNEISCADKNIRRIHEMAGAEGVSFIEGLRLSEVRPDGISAERADGEAVELACDTIVLSMGVRPRAELMDEFRDICDEVYFVGDCVIGREI